MKLSICKKICNACPFSNSSLNGWLGSHTIEEIQDCMSREGLFSCHKTRGEDAMKNLEMIISGEQPICRGYIISSIISCKQFGSNINYGDELLRLQKENPPTPEEREKIMPIWEFKEHHSKFL